MPFAVAFALHAHDQAPGLAIRLNAGCADLTITGSVNSAYVVQYATDLSATNNWQVLTNLTLPAAECLVSDAGLAASSDRFYRVLLANSTITVTDAQLEDMCSRICDTLTATPEIPETITIGSGDTNAVTAAELHYLMCKWLQYYQAHTGPPSTATISGGTGCPPVPVGMEAGQINLADILVLASSAVVYIDDHHALPNCSILSGTQYTTKAMLWVFARTINWYQDHTATMPNYATVRAVAAPGSWAETPPPTGIKVAVFTDPDGGSTAANCITATLSILSTNTGFNASTITGASIRAGGLTNYDVVMFPGGSGTGEATALQQTGCAKVEQFVANGGGCIGTCAGAFLAGLGYNTETYWLEIVDAQYVDFDHWARGSGLAEIHIVNTNSAIVTGFPETISAQYINGPLLAPGGSAALPDYEQVAVFVTDIHDNAPAGLMPGTTCLTTSTYQQGRCVLFSFHPELSTGLDQLVVRAARWAAGDR